MPNVNISDARGRDAVVKGESTRSFRSVRYVGPNGKPAYTRRMVNATSDNDYGSLLEEFKSAEAVAEAMIKGDPEVDLEREGRQGAPCACGARAATSARGHGRAGARTCESVRSAACCLRLALFDGVFFALCF